MHINVFLFVTLISKALDLLCSTIYRLLYEGALNDDKW